MDSPVQTKTLSTRSGHQIGIATLTREKPLNSLLLETIDLLAEAFTSWIADEQVVCMVLQSSSDRAFCAGADIQRLYHALKEDGTESQYARDFFLHEYELDYNLHQCSKPVLAWGQGLVIGGGLGLLSGCSHRVGTETTRIAMPEITIGLFPDAGGTQTLSRLRGHLGYFMGLTGCQISGQDALSLGILTHILESSARADVMDGLDSLDWSGDSSHNRQVLSAYLGGYDPGVSEPELIRFESEVSALVTHCLNSGDFLPSFEAGLADLPQNTWLEDAANTYRNGSATTAAVFVEQMRRADGMTLAEMFQLELTIAWQCMHHGDFPEGVRALLIDKDRQPHWQYSTTSSVPPHVIAEHFEPLWTGDHPLQLKDS